MQTCERGVSRALTDAVTALQKAGFWEFIEASVPKILQTPWSSRFAKLTATDLWKLGINLLALSYRSSQKVRPNKTA